MIPLVPSYRGEREIDEAGLSRYLGRGPGARTAARLGLLVLLAALAGIAAAVSVEAGSRAPCSKPKTDAAYADGVNGTLAARQDVWGNALLRSAQGPTYAGVRRYLHPLMLVGRPAGLGPSRLTDSGVYYLPFGLPSGSNGASTVQLHVADGSQIVSRMASGSRLSLNVGAGAHERYGSCLARLAQPHLRGGYLPILETSYVDAEGVRYRQESFATRLPHTRALVSFVRLHIDPRRSQAGRAYVRFTPSGGLGRAARARLLFSPGGELRSSSLVYATNGRRPRTVYVGWVDRPVRPQPFQLRGVTYKRARRAVSRYWARRVASGATFRVPERRVMNAERNLLIQNMLMSWRYSLGNSYERFSWELVDVAEVMGDYGFRGIERAILGAALHSRSYFPNRAAGERMAGVVHFYRRFRDRRYINRVTPVFRRYLEAFEHQLNASPYGLLGKERFGADILQPIYGLHAQALALQGMGGMAPTWEQTGHPLLAAKSSELAARLDAGLRAAVRSSETRLADGSLFVPISLLDPSEKPYDSLTAWKRGSYWNLVMPYVLASGFFRPGSPEAVGVLQYMLNHGSRLLGLVRFQPHTGVRNPGYQLPGSDDVYGTAVARFLADNDRPDQLDLSLYGKLGAGMTPGTYVAGEGSTIASAPRQYYRYMHRPPNSGSNAFFLESLRLTLVHETTDELGIPRGLELAYATPRAWLRSGRIVVRRAPTSFGFLSYAIDARQRTIHAWVKVPRRSPPSALRLRLRLPDGERITGVTVAGKPFDRFDPASGTIDLSGLTGRIELTVERG
jgi:hypothetical protein